MFAINIENLKTLNIIYLKKTLGLSIVSSKCGHECKKLFPKKNQFKYQKILL